MASIEPEHREEEIATGEDEDTRAQIAPIVKLEEVFVSTGEEKEDVILDLKAKLYRFDKNGNQWKERGAETVKLLKHKESGGFDSWNFGVFRGIFDGNTCHKYNAEMDSCG